MRSGTELIALGMTRRGSPASPAAMPMTSTPPKANITTVKDAIMPSMPLGKKPPCCHRLARAGAVASAPPMRMPLSSTAAPPAISARIATTLSRDSQNSSSPNTFTLHRFKPPMQSTMPSTQIQRGVSGYQKPMYTPNTVTSARQTISMEKA